MSRAATAAPRGGGNWKRAVSCGTSEAAVSALTLVGSPAPVRLTRSTKELGNVRNVRILSSKQCGSVRVLCNGAKDPWGRDAVLLLTSAGRLAQAMHGKTEVGDPGCLSVDSLTTASDASSPAGSLAFESGSSSSDGTFRASQTSEGAADSETSCSSAGRPEVSDTVVDVPPVLSRTKTPEARKGEGARRRTDKDAQRHSDGGRKTRKRRVAARARSESRVSDDFDDDSLGNSLFNGLPATSKSYGSSLSSVASSPNLEVRGFKVERSRSQRGKSVSPAEIKESRDPADIMGAMEVKLKRIGRLQKRNLNYYAVATSELHELLQELKVHVTSSSASHSSGSEKGRITRCASLSSLPSGGRSLNYPDRRRRSSVGRRSAPVDPLWQLDTDPSSLGISHDTLVGEGTWSRVYRGVLHGTEVAVKELKCSLSPDEREYFRCSAALLYSLHHPRVVQLLGVCTSTPRPLLVLEYLSGGTLFSHIHQQPGGAVDAAICRDIGRDVAQGMNFLHHHQPPVLHGDLKSANVLLDEHRRAKVADLGFSRIRSTLSGNSHDASWQAKGAPGWMSPEMLEGEDPCPASDVYSFGVILAEMLSGETPFQGADHQEVLQLVQNGHRPSLPASTPEDLRRLIQSCWQKLPEERPSFDQVLQLLGPSKTMMRKGSGAGRGALSNALLDVASCAKKLVTVLQNLERASSLTRVDGITEEGARTTPKRHHHHHHHRIKEEEPMNHPPLRRRSKSLSPTLTREGLHPGTRTRGRRDAFWKHNETAVKKNGVLVLPQICNGGATKQEVKACKSVPIPPPLPMFEEGASPIKGRTMSLIVPGDRSCRCKSITAGQQMTSLLSLSPEQLQRQRMLLKPPNERRLKRSQSTIWIKAEAQNANDVSTILKNAISKRRELMMPMDEQTITCGTSRSISDWSMDSVE